MKSLTIYVLSFCAILGFISFKLKYNKLDLNHLSVFNSPVNDKECSCYEFVRNELSLETNHKLNTIYDLREVLKVNGYQMQASPMKGDIALFSTTFDQNQFKKGYAGIVYEVWDNNGIEQIQLRGADSQSNKTFIQGYCTNVGISEFLPIAHNKKKKISYWRKK